MSDTEDYAGGGAMAAHKTTHEDGGSDEISVATLSGLLADDQHVLDAEAVSAMGAKANANPLNHDRYADSEALAATVQAGAITDAVTKAPTHDAVYDVKAMTEDHSARHENGGLDEISVAGLSGALADDQHVLDTEVLNVAEDKSKKGTASGYASLDATTKVPTVELGGAGADNTKYLRGDQSWQLPTGGTKPIRRLIFPASCFETRVAAGWAAFAQVQGTNLDYGVLDFDKDADEKAYTPPFKATNYDGGNVTINIGWIGNATSGNVAWIASLMCDADTEPWDAAPTNYAFAADTIGDTAYDLNISTLTTDPAALAAEDSIVIKISRDVSEDNLAVDARLLFVEFIYTEA